MNPRAFLGCLASLLLVAPAAAAEVRLVAFGEIPASATDTRGDTLGALGSAIAYDARSGDLLLMPDRGPGDGTIDFQPRFHRVRVTRDGAALRIRLLETVLFRDERGRPFTGLLANSPSQPTRDGRRCLDPEALAIAPDGSLYVSDEYAPALLHFDRRGRLLRTLPLPEWYRPRNASGAVDYRPGAKLVSGRTENQGGEALGILPDGKRAVVILQSALAQDGGHGAGTARILIVDLATGKPSAEYAYRFSRPRGLSYDQLSVNDLAVIDAGTLLVLERDNLGRNGDPSFSPARYKAVWRVDLRGATDLLELSNHSLRGSSVRFVKKTRVFNLPDLVRQLDLPRRALAAKWEGIALLPSPQPSDLRLLMVADNDFLAPSLRIDGRRERFERARDAVPTQLFEIAVRK